MLRSMACAVERRHEIGAVEHDVAGLGPQPGPRRAARSAARPVHLPIALQPSTQSWRVIWVRAGRRAQLGEATGAAGARPGRRPPAASRRSRRRPGPGRRRCRDRWCRCREHPRSGSDSGNSRARAPCRVSGQRCTPAGRRPRPRCRSRATHGVPESRSQPARSGAAARRQAAQHEAPPVERTRAHAIRRPPRVDARSAQPVIIARRLFQDAGHHHHEDVHDDEPDERPGEREVDGARGLAAAEEREQERQRRVEPTATWRAR